MAAFEFSKDTFDGIQISMAFCLKSEFSSGKRSLEVVSAIDEKHGSFKLVFFSEFSEKHLGYCGRYRRK